MDNFLFRVKETLEQVALGSIWGIAFILWALVFVGGIMALLSFFDIPVC